jgi:hypothetical protein
MDDIKKTIQIMNAWIGQNRETVFVMFLVFSCLVSDYFLQINRNKILKSGRFTRALILDCTANKSGFFMKVRYSVDIPRKQTPSLRF